MPEQSEPRNAPPDGGSVQTGAFSALLREIARAPDVPEREPTLEPGEVVGRFEIVRELGRGGFGIVYEARDRELGRAVAFKVVRGGGRVDAREERLLREAEAAAQLSHPNIVTLYDVGRDGGRPYLVMELLRGETLARRLAEGPLPIREALRVAIEVAKGLAHAHALGVVHRDLTPGNVFLCEDGRVKVLDLGMAHAFGRRRADGGTPGFMAPEQRRGAPEDERTDVYALGLVLHRMLASDNRSADAKWAAGAPPAELVVPGAPKLAQLVARMLESDPVERPRDAGVALGALDAVQRALDETPLVPAPRVRQRRRWLRWAVTLAVVAAAASALVALALRPRWRAALPGAEARPVIRSIAVLPLASLSTDPQQQYFADGMTDAVITELARTRGLRVVSRGSVLRFQGSRRTTPEIARELDVDAVVEGTVQRDLGRVRVTAQLVHGPTDRHLWAESYERDLGDVLQLEGDIARAIAGAVLGQLPTSEPARFTASRRVDPEAYDAYLRGRYLWGKRSDEALARAIASLRRAIAIDPAYAAPWAALADCYIYLRGPPRESLPKARAAALRAIALDPSLPEAHVALGNVRFLLDWDFKGAEEEMDRAVALDPASVEAHHQRSHLFIAQGRFGESLRESERALALDPLAIAINGHLAYHLIQARRFDAAAYQARRALELDDAYGVGHQFLGSALVLGGKPEEAIAELRRAAELEGGWGGGRFPYIAADLARAYVLAGRREEARATLARLRADSEKSYVPAVAVALVHLALGERDEALRALDRAVDERDGIVVYLAVDPRWDALRPDPRFRALLRRVGLPEP